MPSLRLSPRRRLSGVFAAAALAVPIFFIPAAQAVEAPLPSANDNGYGCQIDTDARALKTVQSGGSRVNGTTTMRQIAGSRQFTIYSDTNHSDLRILMYFYSRENQKTLIDSGVKHVFLEMGGNHLIGGLYDQSLSKRQFVDSYAGYVKPFWLTDAQYRQQLEALADFIIAMRQAGIKVHGVDQSLQETKMTQADWNTISKVSRDFRDYIKQNCPAGTLNHRQVYRVYWAKVVEVQRRNPGYYEVDPYEAYRKFSEERGNDQELADRILKLAGSEKAAILFGNYHSRKTGDLDDLLGKDKTVRIELYGDRFIYADAEYYGMRYAQEWADLPHFSLLIEENIALIERQEGERLLQETATPQRRIAATKSVNPSPS